MATLAVVMTNIVAAQKWSKALDTTLETRSIASHAVFPSHGAMFARAVHKSVKKG